MSNVKTNRTFDHWVDEFGNNPDERNTPYECMKSAWNAALESVVQEPALTREQLLAVIEDVRSRTSFSDGRITNWHYIADALLTAGRIPAPATVETPQEGELTREWLDNQFGAFYRDEQTSTTAINAIKARHQQALSAREQAVRAEYTEALVDLEKRFHALTHELAAEKLANEGKYAIGERAHGHFYEEQPWYDGIVVFETTGGGVILAPQLVRHAMPPTLTNEQMAEAWVKWWCLLSEDNFDGWRELSLRQANGETIEQLYRRDVLGAPKEREVS